MLSISLGPLAFPVAPLLLLAALMGALFTARRVAMRAPATTAPATSGATHAATPTTGSSSNSSAAVHAEDAESTLWLAALAGLLAARATHLARYADAYLATPWAALDLRDGGWHAASGWVAAAAVLLWRARRRPALRPALAAAALAAGLAWGLGQALAWTVGGGRATAAQGVPDVPLQAFRFDAKAPTGSDAPSATPLPELAAGRPTVVNLWASWCGPCRAEMPVLAAAQRTRPRVGAQEVRFLFVNQGESAAAVQAYLAREGLLLQDVWLDPGSRLRPAVGSAGLPTTLFFDAQGRLVSAHMGLLNTAALQARLRELQ